MCTFEGNTKTIDVVVCEESSRRFGRLDLEVVSVEIAFEAIEESETTQPEGVNLKEEKGRDSNLCGYLRGRQRKISWQRGESG